MLFSSTLTKTLPNMLSISICYTISKVYIDNIASKVRRFDNVKAFFQGRFIKRISLVDLNANNVERLA